jgi:hypothetical protein
MLAASLADALFCDIEAEAHLPIAPRPEQEKSVEQHGHDHRHRDDRPRELSRRISATNIGPNRFHQNRTVSWLISIPRSAKRSSTFRSDSGYLTYNITTRGITSGELLKYRNGLLIALVTTADHGPKNLV